MQLFLYGVGITMLYIIVAVGIMLLARKYITIPDELFRKILHFILLGAYIPLVFAFETWWMSAIFSISLIIILFPVLSIAGKIPMFSSFVNERKEGEFKSSMVLAVGMMAFSVSICWGLFAEKYLVLASVYAWGIGDGLAALIGKRFGKHKIKWKLADGKKSIEGSFTMFLCSLISVFTVLLIRGGIDTAICFVIAFLAAVACTIAELCTKGGLDTISCPAVAMVIIIPLVKILGG
ncbi:MAG: phosphatidate cytidylyltransferase [Lachnospiraceae bacterium]|nr:phosphatidate cytidylyltransferase [Lachnospiraceae bacterium]